MTAQIAEMRAKRDAGQAARAHSIVTKAGGAAQGVAKAFDAWFQAQVSGAPADRHTLIRLTQALIQKLIVFLKTYRS